MQEPLHCGDNLVGYNGSVHQLHTINAMPKICTNRVSSILLNELVNDSNALANWLNLAQGPTGLDLDGGGDGGGHHTFDH